MHGHRQGPAYRLHPDVLRRNAGRGLARVTELVHEIYAMKRQPNAVGAIGHIDVCEQRNIIAEKVVFTVDFRSHILPTLEEWWRSSTPARQAFAPRWG